MYRTPYNPYGTCIGSQKLLTGYVSDPAQSVWDLYRTSNTPYGICIGSYTIRCDLFRIPYNAYGISIGPDRLRNPIQSVMGDVSDPILSVSDLYGISYSPYVTCIGSHSVRMGFVSDPIHSV